MEDFKCVTATLQLKASKFQWRIQKELERTTNLELTLKPKNKEKTLSIRDQLTQHLIGIPLRNLSLQT